ncbi:M28 family metallopeptidase [Desulfosporosinus fructosivorans]
MKGFRFMKLFKSKVFILLIVLCLSAISWLVYTKIIIKPILNDSKPAEFSATLAYEHVKYLAQKIGPRPAGSKAELTAAQYISYVLKQNGWKVREQPFSKVVIREASILQQEQQVELISSQNIIAELPGSLPDTIVGGAHYDSANLNAPGALDNASGVGVLLELSRVLSKVPHQETYQLIFFGAEEYGLVGSQFYTSQADLSAVRWMLNVDMVGTPLEIDVAGKKSAPPELIKQVTALASDSGIPFHISRDFIMMTRESTHGGSSDFSSFLDKGIPAIGLGIFGRPSGYYHRPEDRLERVSLEEMQKIGDYTQRLLTSVKLEQLGPSVWDELYLPFVLGSNVFILTSNGIRCFTFLTFLGTALMLMRVFRKDIEKQRANWKKVLWILGVTLLLSVLVVGLSGVGEFLWRWIKQVQVLHHAYPLLFLAARIGIALGIFMAVASWLPKVPLARDPQIYWFTGVSLLFAVSLVLALVRIDLAFPFVFWLLCMVMQFFFPNILLVLLGPYFIYTIHFELINSQQWGSFYEALHKYSLIFLGIYSFLLIPIFLAALHVAITKIQLSKKILNHIRKPALIMVSLLILSLGLVPIYTRSYPQTVVVREEWSGNNDGLLHIFSDERLPHELVKDLNVPEGNSQFVPILNELAPINVDASVVEKNKDAMRTLDISFMLNYPREPYLIRFKLESSHPFEIQTDDFLPIAKLPKKIELKGVLQPSGNYSITLQRTPPHKKMIHLAVVTEGIVTCTFEAIFPDLSPRLKIQNTLLSVDYEIQFKESYDF